MSSGYDYLHIEIYVILPLSIGSNQMDEDNCTDWHGRICCKNLHIIIGVTGWLDPALLRCRM